MIARHLVGDAACGYLIQSESQDSVVRSEMVGLVARIGNVETVVVDLSEELLEGISAPRLAAPVSDHRPPGGTASKGSLRRRAMNAALR
jgi:hypothetical protein